MYTLSGIKSVITTSFHDHRAGRVLFKGSLLAKTGKFCRLIYGAFLVDCCQRAVLVSRPWEVFKGLSLLGC